MRLDGWKAIGSHFGRERSTAIRWAAQRGMPVHRIPGAGRGSVYALVDELDAWLETDQGKLVVAEPKSENEPKSFWSRSRSKLIFGLILILATTGLGTLALSQGEAEPEQVTLPGDQSVAALYIDARADWAERSPQSIMRAIGKLREVVAKDPGFAPGYAALADCYVLAREFGSLADAEAFANAQSATDAALRIDPNQPDALRAKGFIEYWWRQDGKSADDYFRRSLKLAPESAQTHFWYGNILIDNGDTAAGLNGLDRARLLEPASVSIQVDLAWAKWSAGDEQRARATLEALRVRHPELATIRDYLSIFYLAEGDLAGFVQENSAEANARGEGGAIRQAERLVSAYAKAPDEFLPVLLDETLKEVEAAPGQTLVWPSFVASAVGKREALVKLLKTSDARNEKWGSAGMIRQIRMRWDRDSEVIGLLNRRIPMPIVESRAST